MASTTSSSSGVGFFGLLTIVFITLKLVGVQPVASWSWWLVLSPMLISLAVFALVLIIIGIAYLWVK